MRDLLRHPLFIVVVSALLTAGIGVGVGGWLTFRWNRRNLIKEVKLEIYKKRIDHRAEFVENLSEDIYSRLYHLKNYYWNLRDRARKEILKDSWNHYQKEVMDWNERLKRYYINLSTYFSKDKFKMSDYIGIKDNLYKLAQAKPSFRLILETEIQKKFIVLHNILLDIRHGEETIYSMQKELRNRIKKLNSYVYEYTEALSKARESYNILDDATLEELFST